MALRFGSPLGAGTRINGRTRITRRPAGRARLRRMSARPTRPARDRLDVWTYFEDGEEIPLSHPGVTDAERAAAGRETLAERWRALLPVNRGRAAERYTAGGLPRRPGHGAGVAAARPRRAA
jgi:hypothetical protein